MPHNNCMQVDSTEKGMLIVRSHLEGKTTLVALHFISKMAQKASPLALVKSTYLGFSRHSEKLYSRTRLDKPFQVNQRWPEWMRSEVISFKKLLGNNVSNSSWHIIMKARIAIKDIMTKTQQKEKENKRNGTWLELDSGSNLTRATSKLHLTRSNLTHPC